MEITKLDLNKTKLRNVKTNIMKKKSAEEKREIYEISQKI